MDINNILAFLSCIIFLFIFGKIFIVPLKNIFKLILNSIFGGILIFIINMIGILVGFLGIPGAGLLVILQIILGH